MQVQDNNGVYRQPEPLTQDRLEEELKKTSTKRILVFAGYDTNGKPTAELRRAWRRYNRTKRQ